MAGHVARRGGVLLVSLALLLGFFVGGAAPAQAVASLGDASNGWRPSNGGVYAVQRVGDAVILGGSFTALVNASGQTASRRGLAAISATSGELLPWAPNPNGEVRALEGSADGRTVYVGGAFTTIGSASRTNLAAVSLASGAATAFHIAAPNGPVRTLLLSSGSLYVGGTFWKIGTANRGGGAALDPTTGALKAWNPDTNWGLYALIPSPDRSGILVGGPFSKIHGVARPYLAKVTASSGALVSWRWGTKCDSSVYRCEILSLAADSSSVYLGIAGPGGRAEAINPATGTPRWAVTTDGDVQSVAVVGDTVYLGGHFKSMVGAAKRSGLAAVAAATGAVQPEPSFLVKGSEAVWSVLVDRSVLRIGGQFLTVDGAQIGRYTSFRLIDRTAPSRPGTPAPVAVLTRSVQLNWATAIDDLGGPVHYRIFRDGTAIGESATATFLDTSVSAGRTYAYTVTAEDATGNESDPSGQRSVTTPVGRTVVAKASRAGYGNMLYVDINPNLGSASYTFVLQKLGANHLWTNLKGTYRSAGVAETRSFLLPKGTYRVYVLGGGGYAPAVSNAVRLTDPTVKVALGRDASKGKLKVNVNPDKGKGYWTFKVQKRTWKGTWSTLSKTYKTKGKFETRTVNLKKGTYRVVVAPKYGYKGATSRAVVLVK